MIKDSGVTSGRDLYELDPSGFRSFPSDWGYRVNEVPSPIYKRERYLYSSVVTGTRYHLTSSLRVHAQGGEGGEGGEGDSDRSGIMRILGLQEWSCG